MFNNKEIKELKRIGTCLQSGMVPVSDVQRCITGILQKVETPSGSTARKRVSVKDSRKTKFKKLLRVA